MKYYDEIEVDNKQIAVEVCEHGEVEVYYLMSDREPSDRHIACAMEPLVERGVRFNV